jgi:hypothetical protein
MPTPPPAEVERPVVTVSQKLFVTTPPPELAPTSPPRFVPEPEKFPLLLKVTLPVE